MADLSAQRFDLSADDLYAIRWLENHGFDVALQKQYVSVTIFEISKDGMTEQFRLPQGDSKINVKKYMKSCGVMFELRDELRKEANT